MRIRRGDLVQVVTGDDSSTAPKKVLQILDGGKRVVVEGVNRVFKHVRRGHPKSPQGGRLSIELPIDSSNVLPYCDKCQKGTRIGYRLEEDGKKVRFCKKCGTTMSVVSPAKTRRASQPG